MSRRLAVVLIALVVFTSHAVAQNVDGGSGHTALITPGGYLWTWGGNSSGQAGDGTTTPRPLPVSPSGIVNVVSVAAGANHTVFAKADGTAWACGANGSGQLGDGTTTQRTTPVQITSLSGVVSVAAGSSHTLALKSDGTVWSWGYNINGQLGDGSNSPRTSPVQVSGLSEVVAIAAGSSHSIAVKSDGSVWAWGYNAYGQLGDNSNTARWTPVRSGSIVGVTAIAAGDNHTLALATDGTVYAWGRNTSGQLGDSSWTDRRTPVIVTGITQATAIAAGSDHSIAARQDGSVWTWGANGQGQLGDGGTTSAPAPLPVGVPTNIVRVGAGQSHSAAISSDGEIWAWGFNSSQQVGDGTAVWRKQPVSLSSTTYNWRVGTPTFSHAEGTYTTAFNVTVASATSGATIRYTTNGAEPTEADAVVPANGLVAISQTTTLRARAWKAGVPVSNVDGVTYTMRIATPFLSPGNGTYFTPPTVTVTTATAGSTLHYTVNGVEPTEADPVIASGGTLVVNESLILKVKGWKNGWTASNSATASYTMKVATPGLSPGAGAYTTSQIVNASTSSPGAVLRYTTSGAEPTATSPQVPLGGIAVSNTALVKVKGFRAGWTDSDSGGGTYRLTLGTVAAPVATPIGGSFSEQQAVSLSSTTPGAVIRYTTDGTEPTLSSRTYSAAIIVKDPATLKARAFKADWTPSLITTEIYAFNYAAVAIPTLVPDGGEYTTIQSVAISTTTPDATVRYTTNGSEPTESDPAVTPSGIVVVDRPLRLKVKSFKEGLIPSASRSADYNITGALAAGGYHTLALKSDGTVWAWGRNQQGQLGDNTNVTKTSPTQVTGLSDVVAIAAGLGHSLAVRRDGTVWGWGDNWSGQLGIGGTSAPKWTPQQVLNLTDAIAVAAGDQFSLALKKDGTVVAWGTGLVGDGSTSGGVRPSPVPVVYLTGVTAVAAGRFHSLALRTDGESSGTVWVWGYSTVGQLGDGRLTASASEPIPAFTGASRIGANAEQSIVARADGSVWNWGKNLSYQLGNGTNVNQPVPVQVTDLPGTRLIAAAEETSYAVTTDGSAWQWGSMTQGGAGVLSGGQVKVPFRVPSAGNDLTVLAAGKIHAVVSRRDGSIWGWGDNTYGALGLGASGPVGVVSTAMPVPGFSLTDTAWLESDADGDGIATWRELAAGTDPNNADSNGDGLLDGAALSSGHSATSLDVDSDGVANIVERQWGTDPFRADTDGDGVSDLLDAFPLDNARSTGPAPNPSDVTPPVIILKYPSTAIPVPPPEEHQ